MKLSRRLFLIDAVASAVAATIFSNCKISSAQISGAPPAPSADNPLPSWNDGPAKQAIASFVQQTTTEGSAQFVQPEERVATFDQDGTLWVEQPIYAQVIYCLDRV